MNKNDIKLGARLRELRKLRDLSQDALAKKVGVTFQQIQKYEKGVNRISASMLYDIAKVLEVYPSQFYIVIEKDDRYSAKDIVSDQDIKFLKMFQNVKPGLKGNLLTIMKGFSEAA